MASVILFIVAMGVITALGFAAASSQQSTIRAHALNLANQRLEQARNIPYDNVGVVYEGGHYGDPAGDIPAAEDVGDFLVETQVDWSIDATSGRAEYKNIRISVSWQNPRPGAVTIASAIYGSSGIVNSGDLKVYVLEQGTEAPIDMAEVWVSPNGMSFQRHKWTGADGTALFGVLPLGTTPVAVTASGWVFDTITPADILPDIVTSIYIYGCRPVTVVVNVIDTLGTPIPNATVRLQDSKLRYYYGNTGADGVATITGLLPDNYGIQVSAADRENASGSIAAITAGGTFTTTITMSAPVPPGSLRIRVKNSTGTAIQNASVAVVGPSPATTPVAGSPQTTPTSGEVFFASLHSGTYTVNVTAAGYNNYTNASVVIHGHSGDIVDVVMTPTATTGSLLVQVWRRDGPGHPNVNHPVTIQYWHGSHWDNINDGGEDHWHTDHEGQVVLNGLIPGTYRVNVQGAGQQDVAVQAGTQAQVVFQAS